MSLIAGRRDSITVTAGMCDVVKLQKRRVNCRRGDNMEKEMAGTNSKMEKNRKALWVRGLTLGKIVQEITELGV